MSFLRRLTKIMPSFGTALQDDKKFLAESVPANNSGIVLPLQQAATFSPTISSGWIRVKFYISPDSSVEMPVSGFTVVGEDNLGREVLCCAVSFESQNVTPTSSIDVICPFLVDLNIVSMTIFPVTSPAPGFFMDIEIAATSGEF